MARRERERYTERTRPHRRDVDAPRPSGQSSGGGGAGGGGVGGGGGLGNPVIMIALGGFALALVLAVAVLIGRNRAQAPATAGAETPGAATADPALAATVPVTTTNPTTTTFTSEESMPAGRFSAPEPQSLDGEANAYFATVETVKGTFKAELWPSLAPETVNSFVFLAREGFFDGLTIHRVEPGFVIQGGDPNGNGTGGPGYQIKGEFTDVPHVPGILSMARTSEPDSAGSQFFVVIGDASHLDDQYAVFGYVFEGMDVVYKIAKGDKMNKVTIEEKPKAESVVSPDDVRAGTQPGASAGGGTSTAAP